MEYNTTRTPVLMLEYGRGIQAMAEHLLTIEDRQKRRVQAEVVIDAMAALNPALRAVEDYRHKLWDHLHVMTGYKLDVECPYPVPVPAEAQAVPERPSYPQTKMRHRQFGKKFDELLKRALDEKDEEKRQAFTQALGYYMKLAYTTWHKEQVYDDAVKVELERLTDGLLQYQPGGVHVPFVPLSSKGQQGGNRLTAGPAQAPGARPFKGPGGHGQGGGGQRPYGQGGGGKGRKFYKNRNK
jgi:hypothetical protein